ncbi:MAG TPA: lysophospholipid acyltransferase family protein [Pyrinomonadaceae bacterium]|nr:lysophospholipid acyltransferase family protein [Pyrinomonadaceae bacterium]
MAKHGKLQTSLEYAAARIILSVVGALPFRQSIRLGRFFGLIAYLVASELRRTGEINLKLAFPQKTAEERRQLLKGCFESLGRALGVFSHFADPPESILSALEPSGIEHLDQVKASGRGAILFTAHLGAWELTSYGLSLLGHPVSFLVRPIDNPKIEEIVDRYRTRTGNKTLDKFSAARSMVKTLRSGEFLGLLIDLNALEDEAIFVNFFGVPASTNFMTAKLALRSDVPIIPVFAPWDKTRQKFLLQVNEPVEFERSGDEEADVRELTTRLTQHFEDQIRRYPDQWLWIHKRWKTRPHGEPGIY